MEADVFPRFLRAKAFGNLTPVSALVRLSLGLLALWAGLATGFAFIFFRCEPSRASMGHSTLYRRHRSHRLASIRAGPHLGLCSAIGNNTVSPDHRSRALCPQVAPPTSPRCHLSRRPHHRRPHCPVCVCARSPSVVDVLSSVLPRAPFPSASLSLLPPSSLLLSYNLAVYPPTCLLRRVCALLRWGSPPPLSPLGGWDRGMGCRVTLVSMAFTSQPHHTHMPSSIHPSSFCSQGCDTVPGACADVARPRNSHRSAHALCHHLCRTRSIPDTGKVPL